MVWVPGILCSVLPAASLFGGLLTTLAIYLVVWRNGINPTRMVLAGVATSTFLRAGVDALMVFFADQLAGFVSFSVGGLSGVTWRHVWMLLPYAAAGLFFAVLLSQRLNILLLGDDAATGLGLPVDVLSWGSMLALADRALLLNSWWVILIPGVFLVVTLLSITSIGHYFRKRSNQGPSNL